MFNIIAIPVSLNIPPLLWLFVQGGQFVVRYGLVGRPALHAKYRLSYIPANPSTYPYLDATRPRNLVQDGSCAVKYCDNTTIPTFTYKFAKPSSSEIAACPDYDDWRNGYELPNEYVEITTKNAAIYNFQRILLGKSITFLLGQADVCNSGLCPDCDDHSMDESCAANWQVGN
jgi:hypothetical protein